MSITELLSSAGRVLPELALKAALVLAVAGAVAFLLRRRSASVRHLVWTTALAGVLFLPLGHLLPLRIAVLPASLGAAPAARLPAVAFPEAAGRFAEVEDLPAAEPAARTAPAAAPQTASAWLPPVDRATALVGVWLLVALALVGRLGVGTATVWWLARRGERIDDPEWTAAADRISRAFDAPSARLVRTSWTEMPMTWGFVRPVVLLPADCGKWPAERRDVVLRHELAHVARRDVATLVLAQLACAVHWFNPLSWIALHQLRAEAERCCDDWVLSSGTRASTYAGHLLEMVRVIGRARVPSALALPMAQRSTFEGRLLAILEPGVERGAPGRGRTVLTVGGLAAVIALLGALRPADAAATDGVETVAHADVAPPPSPLPSPAPHPSPAPAPLPPASAPRGGGLGGVVAAAVDEGMGEALRELRADARGDARAGTKASAAALEALTGAMADADVLVRRSAVQALGSLQDPRSVQALVRALRGDADPEVRRTAAWALGQIESRAATAALVEAMASDRSLEVRRTAVWALGQIEDPAAVDGLVRAVRDADPEVRATAVWALGQTEDRRAVPALTAVLREGDPSIRKEAAWALGQIESPEAVPALVEALRGGDPAVRVTAVWALGQIESAEAVPALAAALRDRSPPVRAQAAWALGQIEPQRAPAELTAALRDEDRAVRMNATWALGQIGDTPALEGLLRAEDPEVRRAAARALGGGPDPRPQPQPQPRPRPMP